MKRTIELDDEVVDYLMKEELKYWHKVFKDDVKRGTGHPEDLKDAKKYKKAIKATSEDLRKILEALYRLTIKEFGQATYKKLEKQKALTEFTLSDAMLQYILETTAKEVVQIDQTTEKQIQERIKLGQGEGLSVPQIAKTIDDLYLEKIIPNRSSVIARTETISSSNHGSLSGALQAEEDFDLEIKKEWIRTFDKRVRDTHIQAGKHKPIPLDEKFKVGNSHMKYPGDFEGGPEEVINCRCTIAYVDED